MSQIAPCLWFDGAAETAARFYVALFPNSSIDSIMRAPTDFPATDAGEVVVVGFTLDGRRFQALNGGPMFKFTEAVSLAVTVADQAELDRLWDALIADGGAESQCGWLKDRWGLSWQIVPRRLYDMYGSTDAAAAKRAAEAMLGMRKLDLAALEAAFAGTGSQ